MITSEIMRLTSDGKWYREEGLHPHLAATIGHGLCADQLREHFTIKSKRIQLSLHRSRREAGPNSMLVEHFAEDLFLLGGTDDTARVLPMMGIWFLSHIGTFGRAWVCVWELQ